MCWLLLPADCVGSDKTITKYNYENTEISAVVSLVVVKPEIQIDKLDPSVLTVTTNGKERNVLHVYPCDSRGAYNPVGEYLVRSVL